eukprot:SAG31_NODE_34455_length_332_cov_2.510730_1_plen_62_part_00
MAVYAVQLLGNTDLRSPQYHLRPGTIAHWPVPWHGVPHGTASSYQTGCGTRQNHAFRGKLN